MNYLNTPKVAIVTAGAALSPLALPLTVAAVIAIVVALVLVALGVRRRRHDARAAGLSKQPR